MMKETMKRFVNPSPNKILLFLLFMVIALAGHTQGWIFVKDTGMPKPFLFDIIIPFPFWSLWTLLLFPLGLLSRIIVTIGGFDADFIMRGSPWLFWTIQTIYFYLCSCLWFFVWEKYKKGFQPCMKLSSQ